MPPTGPKPKPTALKELHGTQNVTRDRARKHEPVPPMGDIDTPPDYLTDDQKADWVFAVKNAPAGVIFACDRGVLEVYIVAADHHRIANRMQQVLDADNELKLLTKTSQTVDKHGKVTGGGNIIMSPYLGIISTSGQRMLRAAAELGFTPAARPRLSTGIYDPALSTPRQAPRTDGGKAPAREPNSRDLDNLMGERATLN